MLIYALFIDFLDIYEYGQERKRASLKLENERYIVPSSNEEMKNFKVNLK